MVCAINRAVRYGTPGLTSVFYRSSFCQNLFIIYLYVCIVVFFVSGTSLSCGCGYSMLVFRGTCILCSSLEVHVFCARLQRYMYSVLVFRGTCFPSTRTRSHSSLQCFKDRQIHRYMLQINIEECLNQIQYKIYLDN